MKPLNLCVGTSQTEGLKQKINIFFSDLIDLIIGLPQVSVVRSFVLSVDTFAILSSSWKKKILRAMLMIRLNDIPVVTTLLLCLKILKLRERQFFTGFQ